MVFQIFRQEDFPMSVINMKCPQCGGAVEFNPATGTAQCTYCFYEFPVEAFSQPEGLAEETSVFDSPLVAPAQQASIFDSPALAQTQQAAAPEENYMDANIYHCTSCGAELMLTGTEASAFCSFCGSPSIVFDRVSKELRPRKIIPFKITADQALRCIKDRFGYGGYIPEEIRELNVEKVRAIYMPYFRLNTYMRMKMNVTVRSDKSSGTYYRDASAHFKGITLDGARRLSDEMSQRLEPFAPNELVDFDVAYLSGFYADKFDTPMNQLENIARERSKKFVQEGIIKSCPYAQDGYVGNVYASNVKKEFLGEEFVNEGTEYCLFPAYFINLLYKGNREIIIVNGQTGKVVGTLPMSKRHLRDKFAKTAALSCLSFCLLCIPPMVIPELTIMLAIPFAAVAFSLIGGITGYNKYKKQLLISKSKNMNSYVNTRGDR